MRRLSTAFALLAPMLAAVLAGAFAAVPAAVAQQNHPAVLTVTGEIAETNRPKFQPFRDALFAKLDAKFKRAYAFDGAELRGLPQQTLTVGYPNWPGPVTVRGPLLGDVLDHVGAQGERVVVQAIDGYAPEFDRHRIDGFVLALEADGRPLAVGGRGPAWLVLPKDEHPIQPVENDGLLAWGVFHIRVIAAE